MQKIYLLMANILLSATLFSQGVKISANPGTPNASSILELESTSKGFLLPRLTTIQRNAIVNPAIGLEIYNTTSNCLEIYFPNGWNTVACDCNAPLSSFTYLPTNITTNTPVVFTPTQGGATYSWTFQNGSPANSTAQNPSVTWSNGGTYTVTLTVTLNGCSSTTTASVTVSGCSYTPGTQTLNVTGSGPTGNIQTFTVPGCVNSVTIDCRGAQGGGGGGNGARMIGTFTVTPGDVLNVIVGQQGLAAQNQVGNGGGGGSFVVRNGVPLIIAGGGGGTGHNNHTGGYTQIHGTTANNGAAGDGTGSGAGGTAGNGGAAGNCSGTLCSGQWGNAGGGGGFLSNGGSLPRVNGGLSFGNGGNGGVTTGGFGGGAGGDTFIYGCQNGNHGGGGGGGYSGGGGGGWNCNGAGGGGGSYNVGTNQNNTSGFQTGNGQVIITW